MTAPALPYLLIDAFANQPLTGNPAAVVRLPPGNWPDPAMLQALAGEFNVSQTAYLLPSETNRLAIRWFSPKREVPLCGHASLAACRAARHWGLWQGSDPLRLLTDKRGELLCRGSGDEFSLRLAALPSSPTKLPERVQRGLGVASDPIAAHTSSLLLLLELASAQDVLLARPNPKVLTHWHRHGVAITARDTDGFDFITRMFAPRFGIDEDPACGSAHTVIGPYWAAKLNKSHLLARQGSPRRGQIAMTCHPTPENQWVDLKGATVLSMEGTLGPALSAALLAQPSA